MNTTHLLDLIYTEWYFEKYHIFTWCLLPFNILGLITNILNIAVYTKIGLKDSVSICFFALSICDLCFIIIRNNVNIISAITQVEPIVYVLLDSMVMCAEMIYDISAGLKTFIAVQRGICVVFPFHANRVFTNKSTIVVISCICLFNLVSYINDAFIKVKCSITNSFTNGTYYYELCIDDGSLVLNTVGGVLNKTAAVCVCEVLALISVMVIVWGMASTTKWRQSVTGGKINKHPTLNLRCKTSSSSCFKECKNFSANHVHDTQQKQNLTQKQNLVKVRRELRVVKHVVLVCAIHLMCYTPVAAIAVLSEVISRRDFSHKLHLFCLYLNLVLCFTIPFGIHSNFFIYYTYNSKFKQTLLAMSRRVHAGGLPKLCQQSAISKSDNSTTKQGVVCWK